MSYAYIRESRARRHYTCATCGSSIPAGQSYFRDEPHPMARLQRGAVVRHLCLNCLPENAVMAPRYQRPSSQRVLVESPGQLLLPLDEAVTALPPLLFKAALTLLGERKEDGYLVEGVTIPWFEIIDRIARDPDFLFTVPWRKVEELIAGAYEREGWENVILTPSSGDRGRDIIAERPGRCAIKIIDQVKAFSPGRRVSADDVRSVLGVLSGSLDVSKAIVTTTAEFAPRICEDPQIKQFIPYRLELKSGDELKRWLLELRKKARNGV